MGLFSGISKAFKKSASTVVGGAAGYLTGGWGGAAAGALGAYAGSTGERSANKANSAQALRQMQFQERMSNTSHQREVADLRAAGLNPMLSVNAGASSPGGAQAVMKNIQATGVNSALMAAQIRQINAQTGLTNKQADAIEPASAVGQGVEYIKNLFKETNSAESFRNKTRVNRTLPDWMKKRSKRKYKYPDTYKHNSIHSKAEAYPLGSRPNPLNPKKSQKGSKSFRYLNEVRSEFIKFGKTKIKVLRNQAGQYAIPARPNKWYSRDQLLKLGNP